MSYDRDCQFNIVVSDQHNGSPGAAQHVRGFPGSWYELQSPPPPFAKRRELMAA
jgi:hypothetical protein